MKPWHTSKSKKVNDGLRLCFSLLRNFRLTGLECYRCAVLESAGLLLKDQAMSDCFVEFKDTIQKYRTEKGFIS